MGYVSGKFKFKWNWLYPNKDQILQMMPFGLFLSWLLPWAQGLHSRLIPHVPWKMAPIVCDLESIHLKISGKLLLILLISWTCHRPNICENGNMLTLWVWIPCLPCTLWPGESSPWVIALSRQHRITTGSDPPPA